MKLSIKREESYTIYIFKVLHQLNPDIGISSKAVSIVNSFVNDIFEHIAAESSRPAHYNKKPTTTSREIQTAVCLLLMSELAKRAIPGHQGSDKIHWPKVESVMVLAKAAMVTMLPFLDKRKFLMVAFRTAARRMQSV